MDSTEEARSSGSAPDTTPEARHKEMLDQILVMVTKMASDLKECNAALRAARTAFVADSDDCGRKVDFTAGTGSSSEYLLATSDSQIDAKLSATALIPSPTSAPPQDVDPGFPSGVTELAVSTDGNLGVVFDADDGGVNRLSHLPDPPATRTNCSTLGHNTGDLALGPSAPLSAAQYISLVPVAASDNIGHEVDINTGIDYNSDNAIHCDSILAVSWLLAGAPDIFESAAVLSLPLTGIETLLHLENRVEAWLAVLYAPWRPDELMEKLVGSGLKAAKFCADGQQNSFAQAELQLQSFVTKLLGTLPTRCSTLALYQAACILVSLAPAAAFPTCTLPQEVALTTRIVASKTATMTDSSLGINKGYESYNSNESYLGFYSLQVAYTGPCHKATDCQEVVTEGDKILQDSDNIRNEKGWQQPKPPWLLCREVFRSWYGKMQLISGFLLEVSPWCSVSANYLLAYSGVQFWMHCHGFECLHECPALGMISPLSLLRPPVSSNPSCKPYIDNSCIITFDPGITYLSICTVRFTISDDQAMSALLLRKEQFRAIIPFQKSREEFLATVEFAMLTSKCSPHYVRYLSEIKTATILSIVLFESEEDERKPHRLHFLDNAAQDDGGNIRGVAALLLYNLSQMWLFTAILAAGKCLLLSGEIYLITYSWSQYQLVSSRAFQLEGDSARLDLQEDNLPHGHCYLLKNVVVYMVIASQMAFESIKSGGLIAQDGSKGRVICDYSIQFMLETVFFKGGMALDGDFDLLKLFHGSLLQAVLTLQFFVVCHGDGVVQWDRKILLLTWEILKVQKRCGSFASAPSWTRLKQDQIKVSGNAAKQWKLYTIPNYAFLSDSTCTTVALKESIYKIALSINDSKVNIQNKWCRLLCSSPRVEEMVFQLFVLNGTLCSMPQLLSASQCSVPWDPGIYEALRIFHITIHGLGASRVSRRGECHDTATDTWAGPMKGYLGWAITKGRQCLNVSLGQVGRDDTIKH